MPSTLSNEEKRKLSYERQNAVRLAWNNERNRVLNGQGTRDWSVAEQKELIERGSVSGYEGHHMKSVSLYPEYAGDPRNIQFLTEDEHLNGAHQGKYHNVTNGYYDPYTKTMYEFKGDELIEAPTTKLSNVYQSSAPDNLAEAKQLFYSDTQKESTGSDLEKVRKEYESSLTSSDYSMFLSNSSKQSRSNSMGR